MKLSEVYHYLSECSLRRNSNQSNENGNMNAKVAAEVYLEPCQTSNINFFATIVKGFNLLTNVVKSSMLQSNISSLNTPLKWLSKIAHCVKKVGIRSFSDSYFPAGGPEKLRIRNFFNKVAYFMSYFVTLTCNTCFTLKYPPQFVITFGAICI